MNRKIFTVTQVNRYIKRMLDDDGLLGGLFVEGELSNVKIHSSGHVYFTLKDENAAISAVMFKGNASSLGFEPKNGMKAIILGYVSLYEKTGQYQLYAELMEPAGIGKLQAAFVQLRDRLAGEGLFGAERKKPVSKYIQTVAVITSPTGAALHDIIKTIRAKNTAVKIIIAPALVQGSEASADVARAIREVNEHGLADVIILGRGGGSLEDLWAFNEETTARAIADSAIPIISAVGHETDFTIADFTADMRAPTPTAAAGAAVFDLKFELTNLDRYCNALHRSAQKRFSEANGRYKAAVSRRVIQKPFEPLHQRQIFLSALAFDLYDKTIDRLNKEKINLQNKASVMEKISPYNIWKRGYALIYGGTGSSIKSAAELVIGERARIRFADGYAEAEIIDVTVEIN